MTLIGASYPSAAPWEWPLLALTAVAVVAGAVANAYRPASLTAGARALARSRLALVVQVGAVAAVSALLSVGFGWPRRALEVAGGSVHALLAWPSFPLWLALVAGGIVLLAGDAGGVCLAERAALAWRRRRDWLGRPLERHRWSLSFGAAALATVCLVFPDVVRPLVTADPPPAPGPDALRYTFNLPFVYRSTHTKHVVSQRGFEPGHLGLTLPPSSEGQLTLAFDRPAGAPVVLSGGFFDALYTGAGQRRPETAIGTSLEVSVDGGSSFKPVLENTPIHPDTPTRRGGRVHLDPHLGPATEFQLRYRASNPHPFPVPVLQAVMVDVVRDGLRDGPSQPAPQTHQVLYLVAAGFVLLQFLRGLLRSAAAALALATATFIALCLAAAHYLPLLAWGGPVFGAAALALAARIALPWLRRTEPFGWSTAAGRRLSALAAAAVALAAFGQRWSVLAEDRYLQLMPDAFGYKSWALDIPALLEQSRLNGVYVFYSGAFAPREPLWIFVLHWVFDLIGPSTFHLRLTSLVLSVATVYLTYLIGRRALHPLAGLAAAAAVALDPLHTRNAVQGLREELASTLVLLLLCLLYFGGRLRPAARAVLAGAVGAGLVLTRSEAAVLVVAFIAAAALLQRWKKTTTLLAGAVFVVLVAPMYAGFAFRHGDPFVPSTFNATVNRNLEFPERHGTPGFPTREEYERFWDAGPKISAAQYLFGYHTPLQIVGYSARGVVVILRDVLFRERPWQLLLFAAGLVALVVRRRWAVPLLFGALIAPPYSFMAGAPNNLFVPRYALHLLPWGQLIAAYGLVAAMQLLGALAALRRVTEPTRRLRHATGTTD